MNLSYRLLIPVQEDEKGLLDILCIKMGGIGIVYFCEEHSIRIIQKKGSTSMMYSLQYIILGVCYLQFVKPYPSCCGHIFTVEFHKSQFGQFNTSAGIVPESLF